MISLSLGLVKAEYLYSEGGLRLSVCLDKEGLDSKVKLSLYRTFSKEIAFKALFACDAWLSLDQGHMGLN